MMNKVEKFITDNEIFKHGDSVLLGVSGGADSTCLLYVLNEMIIVRQFCLIYLGERELKDLLEFLLKEKKL